MYASGSFSSHLFPWHHLSDLHVVCPETKIMLFCWVKRFVWTNYTPKRLTNGHSLSLHIKHTSCHPWLDLTDHSPSLSCSFPFTFAQNSLDGPLDHELVMHPSNVIILITVLLLAILLFLVILDMICCFGFNAGLMRLCCGGNEVSICCFGSSSRRSIRSGTSSIQKEDPEDHDHLNHHSNHQHHHLNHHHGAQDKGDAVWTK